MSIEIEVLTEAYLALKQYIPVKDQQEAADNLMGTMVDMLSDHDLRELGSTDKALTRAVKEYIIEDEDTDLYDEE